jgi:hypothetical protein
VSRKPPRLPRDPSRSTQKERRPTPALRYSVRKQRTYGANAHIRRGQAHDHKHNCTGAECTYKRQIETQKDLWLATATHGCARAHGPCAARWGTASPAHLPGRRPLSSTGPRTARLGSTTRCPGVYQPWNEVRWTRAIRLFGLHHQTPHCSRLVSNSRMMQC